MRDRDGKYLKWDKLKFTIVRVYYVYCKGTCSMFNSTNDEPQLLQKLFTYIEISMQIDCLSHSSK